MRVLSFLAILAAVCFGVGLVFVACDDDDDDDGSGETGDQLTDGYYEGLGYIVTDSDSGMRLLFPDVAALLGYKKAATKSDSNSFDPNANLGFDHPSALAACQKAGEKSGENWQLATISNLRSLIRGCPETEWDGTCEVYDDCATVADCWNDDCNTACAVQGPGPGTDGCYATDALLKGTCGKYWSGTQAIVENDPNEYWWTLVFVGAMIFGEPPTATDQMRVVCEAN